MSRLSEGESAWTKPPFGPALCVERAGRNNECSIVVDPADEHMWRTRVFHTEHRSPCVPALRESHIASSPPMGIGSVFPDEK